MFLSPCLVGLSTASQVKKKGLWESENWVLVRIFGPKREEKMLHCEDIRHFYSLLRSKQTLKLERMAWKKYWGKWNSCSKFWSEICRKGATWKKPVLRILRKNLFKLKKHGLIIWMKQEDFCMKNDIISTVLSE